MYRGAGKYLPQSRSVAIFQVALFFWLLSHKKGSFVIRNLTLIIRPLILTLFVVTVLMTVAIFLGSCSSTYHGMKKDTGEVLETTGEAIEDAGKRVKD